MARTRRGEQVSVRVPDFAKARLDELRGEVAPLASGRRPSQPELVAALIAAVKVRTAAQALRAYRAELDARDLGDIHRRATVEAPVLQSSANPASHLESRDRGNGAGANSSRARPDPCGG
jgi:hypothetical protein